MGGEVVIILGDVVWAKDLHHVRPAGLLVLFFDVVLGFFDLEEGEGGFGGEGVGALGAEEPGETHADQDGWRIESAFVVMGAEA